MAAPIGKVSGLLQQNISKSVCRLHKNLGLSCLSAFGTDSSSHTEKAEETSLLSQFKQASKIKSKSRGPIFMTKEADPANHRLRHAGLFYKVPSEVAQSILGKGMHLEYYKLLKAFNEMALMVRKPAVELLHYLRTSNYNNPAHRYIIYGAKGSGKSTCLAHALHFGHTQGWLILHVPWAAHWNRYYREFAMSTSRPGRVDLPIEGIEWLQWFTSQNREVMKSLNLKTTSKYIWSKREVTEEGSSLQDVIDLGLARSKYSNDCVAVLLKEIKSQAAKQGFKVLVAIDGVNAFWQSTTIKLEDRSLAQSQDLTLVHNFMKLLQNDWRNGAVVCTVDISGNPEEFRKHHTPQYLLGKQGFDHLDPYIPMHMEDYSDKEVYSQLEYFIDRKWIQNEKGSTDEGKKELIFLSGRNPGQLRIIANNW